MAQPTFDLLGKNTGIFATRGATSLDLILLALFIVLAPPLVLYVVEVLVGLVLPRARRYVHALLCGLAFGVFAEEVLKRTTDLAPVRLVHLGWIAGLLAALAFLRLEWMRVWLRFLAIAPALFAAMFLFGSPASAVVFGGEAKAKSGVVLKTPKRVVMVVFDEFPEMSLMDGAGKVDEQLFPNFAQLASASTWYRNDTTVAPYTERAVPAILTGRLPPTGTVVPSVDDYPQNLFTMLGGALPFNVHEAVTALCPRSLCAARANDATGVQRLQDLGNDAYHLWRDFASPHDTGVNFSENSVVQWGLPQQRAFVRSLQPGKGPRLDFVHVELPHEPWHLLSTLQDTNNLAPQQGASKLEWQQDEWPAESARREHLLQVQATDTVLGNITRKLKRIGAWDDSMVVVTADHGVAFTPIEGIRSVTDQAGGNYQQILWTPLFVKYPGQAGGEGGRPARAVDRHPAHRGPGARHQGAVEDRRHVAARSGARRLPPQVRPDPRPVVRRGALAVPAGRAALSRAESEGVPGRPRAPRGARRRRPEAAHLPRRTVRRSRRDVGVEPSRRAGQPADAGPPGWTARVADPRAARRRATTCSTRPRRTCRGRTSSACSTTSTTTSGSRSRSTAGSSVSVRRCPCRARRPASSRPCSRRSW